MKLDRCVYSQVFYFAQTIVKHKHASILEGSCVSYFRTSPTSTVDSSLQSITLHLLPLCVSSPPHPHSHPKSTLPSPSLIPILQSKLQPPCTDLGLQRKHIPRMRTKLSVPRYRARRPTLALLAHLSYRATLAGWWGIEVPAWKALAGILQMLMTRR